MKKMLQIFAVVIAATITLNAHAWGELSGKKTEIQGIKSIQKTSAIDDMTKGGFYLHYVPYLPSSKYGFPKEAISSSIGTFDEDDLDTLQTIGKFGFGHGLDLGNMFRLVDSDPIAIGLRVTWFGFGVSGFKANSTYSWVRGAVADVRLLKLGPYFTYKLADKMAVDAFYQVAPTLIGGAITGSTTNDSFTYPIIAWGLTHELGVTYRFDMLSVGVGYGLGNVKLKYTYDDGVDRETFIIKTYANTLRFMLGMKF